MADDTPLAELSRAMKARGFEYVGRATDEWLEFRGAIAAANAVHVAYVTVAPSGLQLPRVRVQLPRNAPEVLAHIGAGGNVCYAAEGSLVLDIFDITGQTLACIDRAAEVLNLSLRGEMDKDLEDEFFAFWHGDICFLDIYPGDPGTLDVLFAGRGDRGSDVVFVTNDAARTRLKLKSMSLTEKELLAGAAFRVKTSAKPRPLQGTWPPPTVASLLQWQGLLDKSARRSIEHRLLEACAFGWRAVLCVVDSPLTQYAFWVAFEEGNAAGRRSVGDARVRLYQSKPHPMVAIRMDDRYVTQRNAPGCPTLAGKKIALVGCGTIGGFLGELLLKAGAGLEDGELALVDPDILFPQNIGRHRLGLNRALQNKAIGLKEELSAAAPTANTRALPVKAEEADLSPFDLIINTTGEEALGHYLTRTFAQKGFFVPTLTIWVEGPGVAVRGLLRDKVECACTRCLADPRRSPLFPVVNEAVPLGLAGHGCESLYVPFPASVSVQAACLAAEMVTEWTGGTPSPRLRTRVTRPNFTQAAPDANAARQNTCPACSS
ncbi:MAG TPA: E2/UBC family protein [Candidatus Accumulibacter phosphatis]|jgi:ThiF family.|nr:E2/UBC family protein [Candidatus Accumulibacter phosphatis]